MMCHRMGIPPISTIGFGRTAVSSPMRVPRPPARITVCIVPPRHAFRPMTKPLSPVRNGLVAALARHAPIIAILLLAMLLRLDGVGFGLPALNDPDEPLFMLL